MAYFQTNGVALVTGAGVLTTQSDSELIRF